MSKPESRTSSNPRGWESVGSEDGRPELRDLERAFLQFVEATQELEANQLRLSAEVQRLGIDLARTNADLKQQIEAKGRLAEELSALLSALPTGVIIEQSGRIYAFNEVSISMVPGLKVGHGWQVPRDWTAIEASHYRTASDPERGYFVRLESRELAHGRSMLLLHDVTATFRSRERAERESKLAAMGRMVAEIAHQLRTPLATATLYSGHLARPDLTSDRRERFAGLLNQQLVWLDGLVARMMSFLRSRPGHNQIVCVEELLRESKACIDPLYTSRGVGLELEIQGGDQLLTVQPEQIRGGIVSILENALTVSRHGQAVCIRATAARSRLDIHIEDEGPGISDDMMRRLFEPFATGSTKGTGLGLAIAKAAIEAHRGQIHASNRPQGGASFHIVLPVLEPL
jgi:two-component system sensor histidine kinase FlrB